MDKPPATFESIAQLIGSEQALNLCEQYGGQTLYIPKATQSESLAEHWRDFFGTAAMEKLHGHFGGQRCYIPKFPPALLERRDAEIYRRANEGESFDSLAADFNITPRYVALIRARQFSKQQTLQGETL